MNMMPCRYEGLIETIEGFKQTGLELIGYNGKTLFPAGLSDDIGTYLLVPKIVRFFNLPSTIALDHALYLFFYGMVAVALGLGIFGLFLLNRSWLFRFFSSLYLLTASFIALKGVFDNYLVQYAVVVAIVPLLLFFVRRQPDGFLFKAFLFLSGIIVGYAHFIRSYSSVAVVLFMAGSIFFLLKKNVKKRFILFFIVLLGVGVPVVHVKTVLFKRSQFFGLQMEQFQAKHVFWHSVYAGLGFLNNDLGIICDDTMVIKAINYIHPEVVYPSKQYEIAVRTELINIIKNQSFFVLKTIFAKAGVIFFYFLLFAGIGLIGLLFRKMIILDGLFFIGVFFNSLFGLIAFPGRYYLLGMIAFAILYAILSIEGLFKARNG